MEKILELKHLAPYLPYGLKITFEADEYTHEVVGLNISREGLELISPFGDYGRAEISISKPILRPLSDLLTIHKGAATFIDVIEYECGGYQIGSSLSNFNADYLPYGVIRKLLEWHFDVFGLIDSGLAIDINTL